ncbi:MAG: ribosome assembly factor SBDS [Candidatus Aenigmarchaeota archaeon]|nr:ribosome assembly factor SBDS [Candidatus Aenigmarchaeota archaeon]
MVVSIEKAVIARLWYSGQKFEIMVDPEKALEMRRRKEIDIGDVLAFPGIYRDVRSAERVSEQDLQKIFGTTDINQITRKIIERGELQLTTQQRREMIENKKNQIATIISKRGINPQTNLPHPQQRILKAIEQAGVAIDPFQEAESQVEMVVKAISSILPLSFQKVKLKIKIPPQYVGKASSILKSLCERVEEKWLGDGSLQANVEIMGGMQEELFQKLSSLTHGQFESRVEK